MFKFLKQNKLITLLIGMVSLLLTGLIASTLSWYAAVNSFSPNDVVSSVITSYFHCGSGTQADPYVITRPIHYYNMVYLHETNYGFSSSTYFQFGYDLDNDGYKEFYSYDDNGVLQWQEAGQNDEVIKHCHL